MTDDHKLHPKTDHSRGTALCAHSQLVTCIVESNYGYSLPEKVNWIIVFVAIYMKYVWCCDPVDCVVNTLLLILLFFNRFGKNCINWSGFIENLAMLIWNCNTYWAPRPIYVQPLDFLGEPVPTALVSQRLDGYRRRLELPELVILSPCLVTL